MLFALHLRCTPIAIVQLSFVQRRRQRSSSADPDPHSLNAAPSSPGKGGKAFAHGASAAHPPDHSSRQQTAGQEASTKQGKARAIKAAEGGGRGQRGTSASAAPSRTMNGRAQSSKPSRQAKEEVVLPAKTEVFSLFLDIAPSTRLCQWTIVSYLVTVSGERGSHC